MAEIANGSTSELRQKESPDVVSVALMKNNLKLKLKAITFPDLYISRLPFSGQRFVAKAWLPFFVCLSLPH